MLPRNPGSRILVPGSRFKDQAPGSRILVPGAVPGSIFKDQAPGSRFLVPGSRFKDQDPESRFWDPGLRPEDQGTGSRIILENYHTLQFFNRKRIKDENDPLLLSEWLTLL